MRSPNKLGWSHNHAVGGDLGVGWLAIRGTRIMNVVLGERSTKKKKKKILGDNW